MATGSCGPVLFVTGYDTPLAHSPTSKVCCLKIVHPELLLVSRLFLCVPFPTKARVRGERLLSTPGVFTSMVGTPPPDFTQGNQWLSQVPRLPP